MTVSCSQCGGQEFRQLFPVPAEVYRAYAGPGADGPAEDLVATVYACLQCGHLERFVDPPAARRGTHRASS